MNKALIISGIVALALVGIPAGNAAGDCSGEVIDLGVAYYVITGDTPDQGWGYLETNGVAGLQRGGVALHGLGTDPCQSSDMPDANFY